MEQIDYISCSCTNHISLTVMCLTNVLHVIGKVHCVGTIQSPKDIIKHESKKNKARETHSLKKYYLNKASAEVRKTNSLNV